MLKRKPMSETRMEITDFKTNLGILIEVYAVCV